MGNVEYGLELSGRRPRGEGAARRRAYVEKVGLRARARSLSVQTLAGHAAARVAGARLRRRPQPLSHGRALQRARFADQAGPARSAPRPVGKQRRHRRLRDPRHRRGDHARRPGAGDVEEGDGRRRRDPRRPAATAVGRRAAGRCPLSRSLPQDLDLPEGERRNDRYRELRSQSRCGRALGGRRLGVDLRREGVVPRRHPRALAGRRRRGLRRRRLRVDAGRCRSIPVAPVQGRRDLPRPRHDACSRS